MLSSQQQRKGGSESSKKNDGVAGSNKENASGYREIPGKQRIDQLEFPITNRKAALKILVSSLPRQMIQSVYAVVTAPFSKMRLTEEELEKIFGKRLAEKVVEPKKPEGKIMEFKARPK